MKRFIITCAVLMSAALLYGAIDLVISKNQGDLAKLYKEEPRKENKSAQADKSSPAPSEIKFLNQPSAVSVAVNDKTAKEKEKKSKREIKLKEFSRAALTDEEVVAENDSVEFLAVDRHSTNKRTTSPRLAHVIDSVASGH